VIEAHAKGAIVEGKEHATACGLALFKDSKKPVNLTVTSNGVRTRYTIDRWD
jgi:hypothetical protein